MNDATQHPRYAAATILAAMALAAAAPSAYADNIAWNPGPGGNTSWADDVNWTGGTAPADNINDDIAVFSGTTAYDFQPTLDAFTVRSVNGLTFGGASAVAVTLAANTGTQTTSGATLTNSSTITLANVSGLVIGQHVTGTRIPLGTFITAIDGNTITISRPTSGGTLNDATSLTFTSSLRIGSGGMTLLADTPNVGNTITAPLLLGANQTWNNATTNRTLAVQGSVFLDNHTLTLNGASGSTISFNGSSGTQSIGGTGGIIVDTDGTVSFGPGTGGRQQNSYTGGVTLEKGRIVLQGGNSGGTGTMGGLGTGVLTINGGEIGGGGNIAGQALTISGQVWNTDWTFNSNRSVNMGTGGITLGTAAGSSRTLTVSSGGLNLTLGGDISNGTTANSFIKAGVSELIFNGNMLITGDTIVQDGTFTIGDGGSITIYIGADGVSNQLSGDGILNFNGDLIFDLTGADATPGNEWTIFSSALLANTSFAGTFGVDGFSGNSVDGIWTFGDYTFSQSTGLLTFTAIPEPSAFAVLLGAGALGFCALRRRRAV